MLKHFFWYVHPIDDFDQTSSDSEEEQNLMVGMVAKQTRAKKLILGCWTVEAPHMYVWNEKCFKTSRIENTLHRVDRREDKWYGFE